MILVGTRDVRLATRVSQIINSSSVRLFAFTVEKLVTMTKEHRPRVVVLDVHLGGSQERVVERLPQLMRLAQHAVVVVMTDAPADSEIEELAALGAYAQIDAARPGALGRLEDAIFVAQKRGRAWRLGRRGGCVRLAIH